MTLLLIAGLIAPALASAAEMTQVPVHPGEDLITALRRVHPCLEAKGVQIPPQVMADNPERINAEGRMELKNKTLKVPTSFISSRVHCAAAVSEPVPVAVPLSVPAVQLAVPTPTATPAHLEHPVHHAGPKREQGPEEHGTEHKNHLTLVGLLDYAWLNATLYGNSSTVSLTSKTQPGIEAIYLRDLSSKWSVGVSYRFLSTAYQEQEGLEFTEPTSALHEVAGLVRYRIAEGSHIDLAVGGAQVDELSLDPDGKLIIDHSFRVSATFLFWQELAHFHGFELLGGLGAQAFIPTQPSTAGIGLAELFRLVVERHLTEHLSAEAGVLGSYERQATPAESHSLPSVAFGAGLGFHF